MSPQATHFLNQLRARVGNGIRVSPDNYRAAFAVVYPTLGGNDFRVQFSATCGELIDANHIFLPRSKKLYDGHDELKLPAWIGLNKALTSDESLPVDPKAFPWAPELRFACDICDARQLEYLLLIQEFLSHGGRTNLMVPAKERSVEIFGEEKRLEKLRTGSLFAPDRLTLDLLRCYVVSPPLVFEACPPEATPRPLLVLENYSTYHSFTRWNRESKLFEAVVYGQGDSFETAAAGLREITQPMNWDQRSFYFGDVDVKGVLIPIFASATLQSVGLPKLLPHFGCYHRLFMCASSARLPSGAPITLPSECQQWLGDSLAHEATTWLDRGIRLPQELVGLSELSRNSSFFASPNSPDRQDP